MKTLVGCPPAEDDDDDDDDCEYCGDDDRCATDDSITNEHLDGACKQNASGLRISLLPTHSE